MMSSDTMTLKERVLPDDIDFYQIREDGSVEQSSTGGADVYIGEDDVLYFSRVPIMLDVRRKYGSRIGVMRNKSYRVKFRDYTSPKMLLGVARKH